MMKNWITRTDTAASVKTAIKALASADDFNRRLAVFRKTNGTMERTSIAFACSKHGQWFENHFERAGPADLFALVAKIDSCTNPAIGKPSSAANLRFDVAAFDFSRWRCQICAEASFNHCCVCGQNICSATTRKVGDRQFQICSPGCGKDGQLEPLVTIACNTHYAPSGSVRTTLPGNRSQARLSTAGRPLSLFRK